MVNFYRRFIPAAARTMIPLFDALMGKLRTLVWNDARVKAFHDTKDELANATLLTHPCPNAKTSLTVDASDLAVGADLQQFVDDSWVPLAFFSQKLRPPERKYSAFDHELLAFYLGIRHFRYFLEGRQFIAFTDQKPLNILHVQSLRSMIKSSAMPPFLHLRVHLCQLHASFHISMGHTFLEYYEICII